MTTVPPLREIATKCPICKRRLGMFQPPNPRLGQTRPVLLCETGHELEVGSISVDEDGTARIAFHVEP